jgi:sigma-54 dependent transcriptional regulator, acetoin dehydrogenase operon transcriptional activator AcoR
MESAFPFTVPEDAIVKEASGQERPTSILKVRRKVDPEWSKYVIQRLEPNKVRPLILHSWNRSRNIYHIDPGIPGSPVSLSSEEVLCRSRENEVLQIAQPIFRDIIKVLMETGHVLTFFDSEGWMLQSDGDPEVREALKGINFYPGANWKEEVVGTNGPGTALAEKRPMQVCGSEHYVEALHSWVCFGAPILDPLTQKVLAVIDATGYKETVHPHTLLLISTVAHAIEQEIRRRQSPKDEAILNEFFRMAAGRLSDGLLAVDHRGRVLQMNSAAAQILRLQEPINNLDECAALRFDFSAILCQQGFEPEPKERRIYCGETDRYITMVAYPLSHEGRTFGAVFLLPNQAGHSGSVDPPSEREPRSSNIRQPRARYRFEDILGGSTEIRQAVKLARIAATNYLSVLITGESGTGKEVMAQAIHNGSSRAAGPFVAVNCGSIPSELIEAELFGYEPGAFTGARRGGSRGKFEEADGGALFLDEVSEMSPSAQVALLRVLEEKQVVRLGSSRPRTVDVRIIADTNKDLRQEMEAEKFRRDLFYRLNVLTIDLPPLRQRREDIPVLASAFLERVAAQLGRYGLSFSPDAISTLMKYDWPGNVRELRNVVERIAAFCESLVISAKDLPQEIQLSRASAESDTQWNVLADQERQRLLEVLRECKGNVTEAAQQLRISRMTLYRKLKRYEVSKGEIFRSEQLSRN